MLLIAPVRKKMYKKYRILQKYISKFNNNIIILESFNHSLLKSFESGDSMA